LSFIILIVFYYYSQQSENRFIKGLVDTYEVYLYVKLIFFKILFKQNNSFQNN